MSQEDETPENKKFSELVKEKAVQVRQHLSDNKKVYLAATGGVVAGGTVVGVIALRHMGLQVPEIQQTAKNTALIVWKPTNTNIALVRRACPDPIPVLDKSTGEAYASINRAAAMTKTAYAAIRNDAHGAQERWERLSDSVFA
jgi:hypothetical protein